METVSTIAELIYKITGLFKLLAPILIPVGSIVIIILTFSRLREKTVAARWLFSLGFIGLFLSIWYASFRKSPLLLESPFLLLIISWLALAMAAVIETWGKKT